MSIDRRDFVKFGALSTLAFALDHTTASAKQDTNLGPLASQARPIAREEYLQRQEPARRYMRDAGIDAIFLTGGASMQFGHGLGMEGHEWTYLVRGNKTRLEPGMTFSDEPGIYIPGEFGVRCEDIMVISESGAELLTGPAPSLERPFG